MKAVTEYTPLKMCTHVLAAIPLTLNKAYHAGVQDSSAVDVNVLVLWLEAANLNIKQTKGMLWQYVDIELVKGWNSSSGRMSSNEERIPWKSANAKASNKNKGGGDGGGKFNALRGNDKEVCIKECDLCA